MIERERLDEIVRNAADLNRQYYEGLLQLSLNYLSGVSKMVLGEAGGSALRSLMPGATQSAVPGPSPRVGGAAPAGRPSGPGAGQGRAQGGPTPATPTLVLEAEAGRSAVGFFLVHNVSGRAVTATPRAENCVDPDGLPGSIAVSFVPNKIELGPGEQMTVQVAATVDEGVEAGVPYRTRLTVPGLADTGIPAVVRRRHSAAAVTTDSSAITSNSAGAEASRAKAKASPSKSGRLTSTRSKAATARKKTTRRRTKKKST